MMAKIGQFVTIPTGPCCNITLDSAEKIVISHQQDSRGGSQGARLTVDRLKLMGFSSETVRIVLDSVEGQAMLAAITAERTSSARGPHLRAFVAALEGCRSVADTVARCQQLTGHRAE
jgi:hypothetical protein